MALILKTSHCGEVRRVRFEGKPRYSDLRAAVQAAWSELGHVRAGYRDDDGDLCTLCEATMADFLAHGCDISGNSVMKLEVSPGVECAELVPPAGGSAIEGPTLDSSEPVGEVGEPGETTEDTGVSIDSHSLELTGLLGESRNMFDRCLRGKGKAWNTFHGKGFGKGKRFGKGKGHRSPASGGAARDCEFGDSMENPGVSCHRDDRWRKIQLRKLLWVLVQLRSGGALDGKVLAGLAALRLEQMISLVTEAVPAVDDAVRAHFGVLQASLADIQALLLRTPGMEKCAELVGSVAVDTAASAGEALSAVLLGISELNFDERVMFFEELHRSQEGRLAELLDWAESCMPMKWGAPVEHGGVSCDGCGMHPLKGPRFTCKECADYDLCAECFLKKDSLHGGDLADHSFGCQVFGWQTPFTGFLHGIGKGLAWAKGATWKGFKGKGFGHGGKGCCGPWWSAKCDNL